METKIKEILLKAQEIVNESGISEDFKQVAYKEVFRSLCIMGSNQKSELLGEVTEKPDKEGITKFRTNTKLHNNSPSKLIGELIEQGFFTQKRRDIDCIGEIDLSKGIKIPRKQMATILIRKLRNGDLKRERTNDGYVYFST